MGKILGLGEAVVDFIPLSEPSGGVVEYKLYSGGSVANFCVAAAKMGAEVTFAGKLGEDNFAKLILSALEEYGVSTKGVVLSKQYGTLLSFVHALPGGNRSYSFLNGPGADKMLKRQDLDPSLLAEADVLHVSSIILAGANPSRTTQLAVLREAKNLGKLVTYDLNYRPAFFENKDEARMSILLSVPYADIIKGTEEEINMLYGLDLDASAERLFSAGISLVVVTRGANGSILYGKDYKIELDAGDAEPLDTTAAGDCFFGSLIASLLAQTPSLSLDRESVERAALLARAAAAISITRWGGMQAMPYLREITQE